MSRDEIGVASKHQQNNECPNQPVGCLQPEKTGLAGQPGTPIWQEKMRRNQKAWLLTWEWIGDHAAVEDCIAGILRPRISRQAITEIVETIYAVHEYYVTELASYSRRPKENPYKSHWDQNHCFCGHNPSLHANYVHQLTVDEDPISGLEKISWVLPPLYRMNSSTWERELVRGEYPKSVTRTIIGPLSDREIGRYKP